MRSSSYPHQTPLGLSPARQRGSGGLGSERQALLLPSALSLLLASLLLFSSMCAAANTAAQSQPASAALASMPPAGSNTTWPARLSPASNNATFPGKCFACSRVGLGFAVLWAAAASQEIYETSWFLHMQCFNAQVLRFVCQPLHYNPCPCLVRYGTL